MQQTQQRVAKACAAGEVEVLGLKPGLTPHSRLAGAAVPAQLAPEPVVPVLQGPMAEKAAEKWGRVAGAQARAR